MSVVAAPPYRWVILAVATFTQAASAFFVQGLSALGVHLQHDLGVGAAQLGLLASAAQVAPIAGLLVAGALLDRFDERRVVSAGAALVGVALVAGTFAPGYPALLVVLLVVGAGYSTVQPGGSRSVASWFDASQRGLAMGVRQAGVPLGAVVASAVLPLLAAAAGWRAAILAGGVVALLGAAAFALLHRRPAVPPPDLSSAGRRTDRPALRRAMITGTCLVSVHSGVGLLTVLHLHEVTALSPGVAAATLVVVQLAGAAGRVLLAAWSDRLRSRESAVTTSLVAVLIALLALVTPAGAVPVIACVLFGWLGFFGIGWYGPWIAAVAEAARSGFALGAVLTVSQVAVVLSPPVLGWLRDVTGGFTASWLLLAGVTAVALAARCAPSRSSLSRHR